MIYELSLIELQFYFLPVACPGFYALKIKSGRQLNAKVKNFNSIR